MARAPKPKPEPERAVTCSCCQSTRATRGLVPARMTLLPVGIFKHTAFRKLDSLYLCPHCDEQTHEQALAIHARRSESP